MGVKYYTRFKYIENTLCCTYFRMGLMKIKRENKCLNSSRKRQYHVSQYKSTTLHTYCKKQRTDGLNYYLTE